MKNTHKPTNQIVQTAVVTFYLIWWILIYPRYFGNTELTAWVYAYTMVLTMVPIWGRRIWIPLLMGICYPLMELFWFGNMFGFREDQIFHETWMPVFSRSAGYLGYIAWCLVIPLSLAYTSYLLWRKQTEKTTATEKN